MNSFTEQSHDNAFLPLYMHSL